MGWPPAVIIVVRHGARLDAADKQWHLSSPTAYDPPLTYGGWLQSRALGARIASILRSRETDDEFDQTTHATGAQDGKDGIASQQQQEQQQQLQQLQQQQQRRRHKVIIHTSPFLRCVQTSIGISSGLAQNPGHVRGSSKHSSPAHPIALKPPTSRLHSSPKAVPPLSIGSPKLSPIAEPAHETATHKIEKKEPEIKKSMIRVDAFLGEWLSPDYFELITPPPGSVMMVASAKADLLHREDTSNLVQISNHAPRQVQGFPGGWGSPVVAAIDKDKDAGPLSSMSSLAQAMPRRDRTSSLSSNGSMGSWTSAGGTSTVNATSPGDSAIYRPPVPNYAISISEPIPSGYVAHARDACVDVDYQWDSMREPHNWGDGGQFGEEWSQMHKRFRRGLKNMLHWYNDHDHPGRPATRRPSVMGLGGVLQPAAEEQEDDADTTDLVVVLVTHGAGCNALIGALTNQPVLLDVGMASLTMAVRKPGRPGAAAALTPKSTPCGSPKTHGLAAGVAAGAAAAHFSEEYEVKLVAHTEHLRSSVASTPQSSRPGSVHGGSTWRAGGPPPPPHHAASTPFVDPARPLSGSSNSTSSTLGTIRRAATVAHHSSAAAAAAASSSSLSSSSSLPRRYRPSRSSSIGLWSATPPADETDEDSEATTGEDMLLNFGAVGAPPVDAARQKEPEVAVVPEKAAPPMTTAMSGEKRPVEEERKVEGEAVAPLGLWGAPRPPSILERTRDAPPRRRWTINDQV